MLDLSKIDLSQMHIFSIEFTTDDDVNGIIALNDKNKMVMEIGGFNGLEFCDADEFEYFVEIKDNRMTLDGVKCTINYVSTETIQEFNDFWDKNDYY